LRDLNEIRMGEEDFNRHMDQEDFKRVLTRRRIPYRVEGKRLIVGRWRSDMDLSGVKTIPSETVFNNMGSINLPDIEEIPSGVELRTSFVHLNALKRIHPSARFTDSTSVISPLLGTGDFPFRTPGISDFRVLNKMISLGLFWRRQRE